jgi:hypothetical protein
MAELSKNVDELVKNVDELLKSVEDWVSQLEEAVVFEPDEGDPIYCLDEVEAITKKMRKVVMAGKLKACEEYKNGE